MDAAGLFLSCGCPASQGCECLFYDEGCGSCVACTAPVPLGEASRPACALATGHDRIRIGSCVYAYPRDLLRGPALARLGGFPHRCDLVWGLRVCAHLLADLRREHRLFEAEHERLSTVAMTAEDPRTFFTLHVAGSRREEGIYVDVDVVHGGKHQVQRVRLDVAVPKALAMAAEARRAMLQLEAAMVEMADFQRRVAGHHLLRVARGRLGRRVFVLVLRARILALAAVTVQRVWRGWWVRRHVFAQLLAAHRHALRVAAAGNIQRCWRGFVGRQPFLRRLRARRQWQAGLLAQRIHALWLGRRVRRMIAAARVPGGAAAAGGPSAGAGAGQTTPSPADPSPAFVFPTSALSAPAVARLRQRWRASPVIATPTQALRAFARLQAERAALRGEHGHEAAAAALQQPQPQPQLRSIFDPPAAPSPLALAPPPRPFPAAAFGLTLPALRERLRRDVASLAETVVRQATGYALVRSGRQGTGKWSAKGAVGCQNLRRRFAGLVQYFYLPVDPLAGTPAAALRGPPPTHRSGTAVIHPAVAARAGAWSGRPGTAGLGGSSGYSARDRAPLQSSRSGATLTAPATAGGGGGWGRPGGGGPLSTGRSAGTWVSSSSSAGATGGGWGRGATPGTAGELPRAGTRNLSPAAFRLRPARGVGPAEPLLHLISAVAPSFIGPAAPPPQPNPAAPGAGAAVPRPLSRPGAGAQAGSPVSRHPTAARVRDSLEALAALALRGSGASLAYSKKVARSRSPAYATDRAASRGSRQRPGSGGRGRPSSRNGRPGSRESSGGLGGRGSRPTSAAGPTARRESIAALLEGALGAAAAGTAAAAAHPTEAPAAPRGPDLASAGSARSASTAGTGGSAAAGRTARRASLVIATAASAQAAGVAAGADPRLGGAALGPESGDRDAGRGEVPGGAGAEPGSGAAAAIAASLSARGVPSSGSSPAAARKRATTRLSIAALNAARGEEVSAPSSHAAARALAASKAGLSDSDDDDPEVRKRARALKRRRTEAAAAAAAEDDVDGLLAARPLPGEFFHAVDGPLVAAVLEARLPASEFVTPAELSEAAEAKRRLMALTEPLEETAALVVAAGLVDAVVDTVGAYMQHMCVSTRALNADLAQLLAASNAHTAASRGGAAASRTSTAATAPVAARPLGAAGSAAATSADTESRARSPGQAGSSRRTTPSGAGGRGSPSSRLTGPLASAGRAMFSAIPPEGSAGRRGGVGSGHRTRSPSPHSASSSRNPSRRALMAGSRGPSRERGSPQLAAAAARACFPSGRTSPGRGGGRDSTPGRPASGGRARSPGSVSSLVSRGVSGRLTPHLDASRGVGRTPSSARAGTGHNAASSPLPGTAAASGGGLASDRMPPRTLRL